MIARIAGMLIEKRVDAAIVDVGGVGYLVHLSAQSVSALGPVGSAVTLRTHTHVREDQLALFGFASEEEERLFGLLIDVSGVGPKLAVNILSGMPALELARALVSGELARLTKIQGVGKKTAERLIVELKDKLKTSGLLTAQETTQVARLPGDAALVSALLNLGYKPAQAERTAEAVRRALGGKATLDEQIREALKIISGAA
ncbi:MAG: Holliday junction branch migration protein RuvA [Deltaproteobacteria bacterium]|nr:Holliday junction branch migration protein RuvA [Deltaproteobacteria bacterium]